MSPMKNKSRLFALVLSIAIAMPLFGDVMLWQITHESPYIMMSYPVKYERSTIRIDKYSFEQFVNQRADIERGFLYELLLWSDDSIPNWVVMDRDQEVKFNWDDIMQFGRVNK